MLVSRSKFKVIKDYQGEQKVLHKSDKALKNIVMQGKYHPNMNQIPNFSNLEY